MISSKIQTRTTYVETSCAKKSGTNPLKKRIRQMYWLIRRRSQLDLYNKRLLYLMIIRPICTYGIQLWGCIQDLNRIQRLSKTIHAITNARWYQRNDDLNTDLDLRRVPEIIKNYAILYEKRLQYVNHLTSQH